MKKKIYIYHIIYIKYILLFKSFKRNILFIFMFQVYRLDSFYKFFVHLNVSYLIYFVFSYIFFILMIFHLLKMRIFDYYNKN